MLKRFLFGITIIGLCGFFSSLEAQTKLTAELLAPISTKTSSVGDRFTAIVRAPDNFNGAILEGHISKLVQPKRGLGKGKPEIAFEFDTLTVRGARPAAISADLQSVTNAQGLNGVDDEGRIIGKTSNAKRVLFIAAIAGGATAAGAILGGKDGAKIGALVGTAVGAAIGVSMTAAGSDIVLNPGSNLALEVYSRQAARR